MVRIEYVDGSEETVETVGGTIVKKHNQFTGTNYETVLNHFEYNIGTQAFIVHDHVNECDCMMIPREFVKSIRHIDTE